MPDADDARRYPWATLALGSAAFALWRSVFPLPTTDAQALQSDFLAFFTAGRIVASGQAADLCDLGVQATVQAAIPAAPPQDPVMGFFYPPPVAALLAPVAHRAPAAAHALWCLGWDLGWLVCLAVALQQTRALPPARRRATQWVLAAGFAAFPPVLLARVSGQPVPAVLLGLLLAMGASARGQPGRAAAALAVAAVKPHFFALAALANGLAGGLRAAAVTAGVVLAWAAATVAVAGTRPLVACPQLLATLAAGGTGSGINLAHTVSLRGLIAQLTGAAPLWAWAPASLGAVVALSALARRRGPAAWPLLLLLASPHALYHDAALLLAVPAVQGVAGRGGWVALAVWALHAAGAAWLPAWPLLSVLSTLLVAGALWRDPPDAAPGVDGGR